MPPSNGPVQARKRSRCDWIKALRGYKNSACIPLLSALVAALSPLLCAMLLKTGTMKHSVLPEPVPLVTKTDW